MTFSTGGLDSDGPGAGSAVLSRYVYDGDNIVLEYNGSNTLTHRYVHGPDVDQILADEDATNAILWPFADNLGTVRDLVNSNGTVQNHIKYESFGKVTSESNSSVNHLYAFTGRERDEETGLQYHRARYYDPLTGKWISEDPSSFDGGDANLSRYVENSPTNYVDPNGLSAQMVVAVMGSPYTWKYDPSAAFGGITPKADTTFISIEEIPMTDDTGKIHEDIPTKVPKHWTPQVIEEALKQAGKSIGNRERENNPNTNPDFDPALEAGHRKRIGKEREWEEKLAKRRKELTGETWPLTPKPAPQVVAPPVPPGVPPPVPGGGLGGNPRFGPINMIGPAGGRAPIPVFFPGRLLRPIGSAGGGGGGVPMVFLP
jgi:RHS repeat-associated protein